MNLKKKKHKRSNKASEVQCLTFPLHFIKTVNNTIKEVKDHLKRKMINAFVNVYNVMTIISLLALAILPLFKKRE